jgi:hypothetical protein
MLYDLQHVTMPVMRDLCPMGQSCRKGLQKGSLASFQETYSQMILFKCGLQYDFSFARTSVSTSHEDEQ